MVSPRSIMRRAACSTSRSPTPLRSTSTQPENVLFAFHVDSPWRTSTSFPGSTLRLRRRPSQESTRSFSDSSSWSGAASVKTSHSPFGHQISSAASTGAAARRRLRSGGGGRGATKAGAARRRLRSGGSGRGATKAAAARSSSSAAICLRQGVML